MWKSARPADSAILWSAKMIEIIRRTFILFSMLALSFAMVSVVGAINFAQRANTYAELRETLSFLSRFSGPPPGEAVSEWAGRSRHRWNVYSEARYFVVVYHENGEPFIRNALLDDSLTNGDLLALAARTDAEEEGACWLDGFLYQNIRRDGSRRAVVFLNCETKLQGMRTLLRFSAIACLVAMGLAFAALIVVSRRIVSPLTENVTRMQRFMTDASHELKTPLTVISANTDVLALDQPDNPWIRSTKKQLGLLRRMVDDMLYLTRVEEKDALLSMRRLNLSPLLTDCADPYAAMAEFAGQRLILSTEESVYILGDEGAIRRLLTVLLDNALKYAEKGTDIRVRCLIRGRHACVETENAVEATLTPEQLSRLFDRFYRADESRDKHERSGYGIGLAIASAVAEKHGGRMEAKMQDGCLLIRCLLPAAG